LYVIDPASGHVAASHYGGVSLAQLNEFLDGGARDLGALPLAPADSALAQAEEALGHGQLPEAVAAYRRALALGGASWPQREPAMAELAWTLMTSGEHQACADLALAEAPGMNRGPGFARVVLAGLLSANMADTTAWAVAARAKLVPLAREATGITPELSCAGGTSDGRFIARICSELVELGPVNETIHKLDERVAVADLEALSGIYRRILERLLLPAT